MRLGYNTNGLAHHELFDALALVAEIGYQSVAITIDHNALSPRECISAAHFARLRRRLRQLGLRSVIETGARYLLDPRQKHEPTLVSADPEARKRRVGFYRHAIHCAAELQSDCVSLWSGTVRDGASDGEAMERLVAGLEAVLVEATARGVAIGFEPEPGMFIDSMSRFEEILHLVPAAELSLTLDVGHLHCRREVPIAEQIRRWAPRLVNVHLEDMRAGKHEHLMFGEGEIEFGPVVRALAEAGYPGGVHVELSRHSHEGPAAARRAYDFLKPLLDEVTFSDG